MKLMFLEIVTIPWACFFVLAVVGFNVLLAVPVMVATSSSAVSMFLSFPSKVALVPLAPPCTALPSLDEFFHDDLVSLGPAGGDYAGVRLQFVHGAGATKQDYSVCCGIRRHWGRLPVAPRGDSGMGLAPDTVRATRPPHSHPCRVLAYPLLRGIPFFKRGPRVED